MSHEDLIEAAKAAIMAVFNDQSVNQSATRESLKDLQDEIDVLIDTLKSDD